MTIHFFIDFVTGEGQDIYLCGSLPELGGFKNDKAVKMTKGDDGRWTYTCEYMGKAINFSYYYFVKSKTNAFYEAGSARFVELNLLKCKKMTFNDEWQGNDEYAPLLTHPFTEVFFHNGEREKARYFKYQKEIVIRVTHPVLKDGETIKIIGDVPYLGEWDETRGLEMKHSHGSRWEIHLPAEQLGRSVRYKFIAGDIAEKKERTLEIPELEKAQLYCIEHSRLDLPVDRPRIAGCTTDLRRLKSGDSWGIGDFDDLTRLSDWCSVTGMKVIDIGNIWENRISTMAIDPIFLNPESICTISEDGLRDEMERERMRINAYAECRLDEVAELKKRYFRYAFNRHAEETFSEPDFLEFVSKNKSWLLPYAAFCTFRDTYGDDDFHRWGLDGICDTKSIEKTYASKNERGRAMKYYIFIQYHCHKELKKCRNHLHSRGISLCGEISSCVSRNSSDIWANQNIFDNEDTYSGTVSCRWDSEERNSYWWWRGRLKRASEYLDAYKVANISDFFRTWERPQGQISGDLGHFNCADGYSEEEIRKYGFDFNREKDTVPTFDEEYINELFDEDADFVKETFLTAKHTLKEHFATQEAIRYWFENICGKEHAHLKDKVMSLVEEILFIEDPHNHDRYHPRINGARTRRYSCLDSKNAEAYRLISKEFFGDRNIRYWQSLGYRRLPEIIAAGDMLAIAGDRQPFAGFISQVLDDLKVFRTRIQRQRGTDNVFGNPASYPYLSICSTGTADMDCISRWWKKNPEDAKEYYTRHMHRYDSIPAVCTCELCTDIVREHLLSSSVLTIMPIEDWCSIDEKYAAEIREARDGSRIPVTVDELTVNTVFNRKLSGLIRFSGR